MKKYSVSLHGHATSISLEPEFWQQICHIAATRRQSVASLISEIDDSRDPQKGAGSQGRFGYLYWNICCNNSRRMTRSRTCQAAYKAIAES